MSKRLDENLSGSENDGLIVAGTPTTDIFSVTVRHGQGILTRGTILAISSTEDSMVMLGTDADGGETLTANCILADDTDTGETSDIFATAYRVGHFNRNAIITKDDYTLSATDEEELRKGGILLSDALNY